MTTQNIERDEQPRADFAAQDSRFSVDLCVNTYPGDLGYLEPTLRHVVRALGNYPFRHRWLVVDLSNHQGDEPGIVEQRTAMEQTVQRLLADGVVDRVVHVPLEGAALEAIGRLWFGDPETPYRCDEGTAIIPYAYAVQVADADFVLHLDADVMIHSAGGGQWIDAAIEKMSQHRDMLSAHPLGGPPRAMGWTEFIFGDAARPAGDRGWHRGGLISTRIFLIDRRRLFAELLPLRRRTRAAEHFEYSLTATAEERGLFRYTLDDDGIYTLHPDAHGSAYLRGLDELIWAAEHGVYPFRRNAYPWNLRTWGVGLWVWRLKIAWVKAVRRLRRPAG